MSPRRDSHACLQTPTDLYHEVWTWLCGCEVAAAFIALFLSLLCTWRAFRGGGGGGSLHFLRYCVTYSELVTGDVSTAAFIKVI